MAQMAILSWRWDGDLHSSRNIASAVHLAKAMSIKYLFVDQISVDQTLDGDALIERVSAFSTMYKTITVIVAYDKADEDSEKTVYRPWIFSEMRLYRYNPGQIIYVSHSNQGSKRNYNIFTVIPPILGDLWSYDFGKHLGLNWAATILETITRVLCEDIEMMSICDFMFIMPPYARVLSTAYETMSRNDYLLTAVLLCRSHERPSVRLCLDINEMDYKRYRFSKTRGLSWERRHKCYMNHVPHRFTVVLHAEGVILKALGLTDPEFLKEYALEKEARRSCLMLPEEETVPLPTVRIASVTL
ncbi:hypothetical protein F9C07_2235569 [Aspergillus flavus]|uniref:Heterokaryon incompatibility domain-containing protein n=1 Tax=Aspergillus flavus (strain ATCC 200026 / FGSC A1120 / IAM 13836 / NRRL 3357 / JCM 12722 / SRRC 167) TaxID=332952 RepID=A0A7U2R3F3_ASPFN|nr:hypothetical protein F9C07_2235569 [Aspergillus flavus]